jgi:uncharacterized protein YbjT (DUF2867 family)
MRLVIFAATGGTGRELVRQALARGHDVVAVARDPRRIEIAGGSKLQRVAADVRDPESVIAALGRGATVLSALGTAGSNTPGLLRAGAQALLAAQPQRLLTLGAYGSGQSRRAAGWATRAILSFKGDELVDKVAADEAVLLAGGTVFHAGPLSNRPLSVDRRTVGLSQAPRRFFPAFVSRATVAAAMLDETESPRFSGQIAIPLER